MVTLPKVDSWLCVHISVVVELPHVGGSSVVGMITDIADPSGTRTSEIQRLLLLGWKDKRIFHSIGWVTPEVFPQEELRQMAAGTRKHVVFNAPSAERLTNLIKTVRREFEAEVVRQKRRDTALSDGSDDGVSLATIGEHKLIRVKTKWPDINRIFGSSKVYDNTGHAIGREYGIPMGRVALLGGEEGAGKTRWYTSLLLHLTEDLNMRCGVFQGEMSAAEYKELLLNMCRAMGFTPRRALENLFVFKNEHHEVHCQKIKDLGLSFFVWDSFPQIANSTSKADIDDIILDIKQATRGQCAALMVQHLSKEGGIKGNNHLSYMADDLMYLQLERSFGKGDDYFSIRKGKARSGGRGEKAWFCHWDDHICVLDAADYNLRASTIAATEKPKTKRLAA